MHTHTHPHTNIHIYIIGPIYVYVLLCKQAYIIHACTIIYIVYTQMRIIYLHTQVHTCIHTYFTYCTYYIEQKQRRSINNCFRVDIMRQLKLLVFSERPESSGFVCSHAMFKRDGVGRRSAGPRKQRRRRKMMHVSRNKSSL